MIGASQAASVGRFRVGTPWMWASGHNGDIRRAAHGYEPTCAAAMVAFAGTVQRIGRPASRPFEASVAGAPSGSDEGRSCVSNAADHFEVRPAPIVALVRSGKDVEKDLTIAVGAAFL
jgi:hypothetical protein